MQPTVDKNPQILQKKSQDVVGDIIDLLVFKAVLVLLYLRRIESLVGFYTRRSSVKIFANALALSILLALLAACGDESSSSVSPEPRQCEEQSDDCDDASSSSEKISKNSSSSQKSADKGKSSSSVEKSKSSSSEGNVASSSSKKDENSSSSVEKAKESSSSVKPSSSDAKSSSSEEVKQSSSSVVASSSSVVEQSSSSIVIPKHFSTAISYSDLEDSRDSRTYKYFAVTGKDTSGKKVTINVMAQNLNVGVMVDGEKNQEDDSKIERYCYDNDSINCLIYGGLYQWAEMMQLPSRCNTESCADLIQPNHQGICPAGWRLLTYNDFYIVVNADDNDAGVKGVRATAFGGHNYTGYSLIGAGIRNDNAQNSRFASLNTAAFWFYPTEQETRVNRAGVSYSTKTTTTISDGYGSKLQASSVRCVMVE